MKDLLPLIVTVNGTKTLEYLREKKLNEKQLHDLASIEKKLNRGFDIEGQFIEQPTPQDKATFIANLLINALNEENEANAAVACSYLATQFEDLKQVVASSHEGQMTIQLLFDQEYQEQAPLTFTPKSKLV